MEEPVLPYASLRLSSAKGVVLDVRLPCSTAPAPLFPQPPSTQYHRSHGATFESLVTLDSSIGQSVAVCLPASPRATPLLGHPPPAVSWLPPFLHQGSSHRLSQICVALLHRGPHAWPHCLHVWAPVRPTLPTVCICSVRDPTATLGVPRFFTVRSGVGDLLSGWCVACCTPPSHAPLPIDPVLCSPALLDGVFYTSVICLGNSLLLPAWGESRIFCRHCCAPGSVAPFFPPRRNGLDARRSVLALRR